ncbi:hypothetical protein [Sphingomonas crusticola]|uniref:hypothetical protein n=1 Tax=Sphingomonas crusticola TaxID=1697973 RepID=UPI0013C2CBCD|nr:hypothetical protein [Sphingomonas crusticola]
MRYESCSSVALGAADIACPDGVTLLAGGSVQDYRLYFLNREGRITRSEIVTVATDAEACAEAERLDHADAVEIWAGARKVALIHPRGAASPGQSPSI